MSRRFQTDHQKEKCLLDEDTISYFKRIASVLKQGFPTDEEKALFIENTFKDLQDEPFAVFQDFKSSRIIEDLVAIAHASGLRSLLTIFAKDWNATCRDKSASHTLQKVILALPNVILKRLPEFSRKKSEEEEEEEDGSDDSSCPEDELIETVLQLTDTLRESLADNLTNTYSSHIARALIQVLGGHHVDDRMMRSKNVRNINKQDERGKKENHFKDFAVPDYFKKKLLRFCKEMFALEDFAVYLMDTNASPVVQTLLTVLKKVKPAACQKYINKVVKVSRIEDVESESTDHIKLPPVIVDDIGSYLVQEIVALASQEMYSKLVNKLFKGRLLPLALHSSGNFVVQRLIRSCPDEDTFTAVFDELSGHIEEVLAVNHCGVIVSIGDACLRLGLKQSEYLKLLMTAFHCHEPEERNSAVVLLLASFKTYEMVFEKETIFKEEEKLSSINYHGSLVLQNLFKFKHTKLVSSSLVTQEPDKLQLLSCDACGSHVIDAFMQSSTVRDKFKDTFINKLKGKYVGLACHRIGSRIIDTIWKQCSLSQKTIVAGDLMTKLNVVQANHFGKFIYRNLGLGLFSQRRQDWIELQGTGMKKRKLFGDILATMAPGATNAKRHKTNTDADDTEMSGSEDDTSPEVSEAQAQIEKMFPGNTHSPSHRGHNQRGGNNRGHNQRGGNNRGHYQRGGSNRGHNQRGGSNRGHYQRGGSNRGHNQRGGSNRGHNQRGGSNRGHNQREGGQHDNNNPDSKDGILGQRGGFQKGRGGKGNRGHPGFTKSPTQPKKEIL